MISKVGQKVLAKDQSRLPEILARASGIQQFGPDEAWSLFHNLSCIEDSCVRLTIELFPKLAKNQLNADELNDTLHDIGEELRHIAYHIGDSRYYKYLGVTTPEQELSD